MDNKEVILIVEDEFNLRQMMADTLRESGYEVLEAEDGADALKQLQSQALPSLITTDISMPGIDGYQFINSLRQDPVYMKIPVMIVSGEHDLDQIATRLQVKDYIPKELMHELFLEKIKGILRH
ncbi:MAG: response regulator [Oligoflexus sp.]